MSINVANWKFGETDKRGETEKGSLVQRPSQLAKALENKETALKDLEEKEPKDALVSATSGESTESGHFRRYSSAKRIKENQKQNVEMTKLHNISESNETKQSPRNFKTDENLHNEISSSPSATVSERTIFKPLFASKDGRGANVSQKKIGLTMELDNYELANAEHRQKIKGELAAVNSRVQANLKRQKKIAAEASELKEEEEKLIAKIERLKLVSMSEKKDVFAITEDLTPLGLGSHTDSLMDSDRNKMSAAEFDSEIDDDSDSEIKIVNEQGGQKEGKEKGGEKQENSNKVPKKSKTKVSDERCQFGVWLHSKFAISIMLFVSIVLGVFGVGLTLLDAGQSSVNNQVLATLRLASRQAEFKIRAAIDANHQRINLLADTLGRTNIAGTDTHISNDMFWLEGRNILNASAAFFAKDSDGSLHGAQIVTSKTGKHSTRILEKTGNKLQYYPATLGGITSSRDGVSLDGVKDADKTRDAGSIPTVIGDTYDPRVTTWYTLAKSAAVAGKPAKNIWSDIYHDATSESWVVTAARAVYNNIDAIGGVTTPTPTISGVVAVDYDVETLQIILEETRNDVLQNSNEGAVTMFVESTDGKHLHILASSDINIDKDINKARTIDELESMLFVKNLEESGASDWIKSATIDAATYADKMLKKKIIQKQIGGSNFSHYYENLMTPEDNRLMISIVKMDDVIHGCYIVIVLPRAPVYEYLTRSYVGSIITTLLVSSFITGIVYMGDEAMKKRTGMGITPVAMITMFVCFIIVIVIWIAETDEVMKQAVRNLVAQLDTEINVDIDQFLKIPRLLNRWNYVLVSLSLLPLSMNTNTNNATLDRYHLMQDTTYATEMSRIPAASRPYATFAASSDGAFSLSLNSESSSKGVYGLGVEAIDRSTGTDRDGDPVQFRYDLARKSTSISNAIELYTRDKTKGVISERKKYDPRKQGWYTNQLLTPDKPAWSGIYVFNSNNKLGITCTKGFNLPGNTLTSTSSSLSHVFAVDYALDQIGHMLNATMERIKEHIPYMIGRLYIIENSGNIVGVSSNVPITKQYPDSFGINGIGKPQRITAADVIDPIVKETYSELVRRTSTNPKLPALSIAGYNGFAAEGTPKGRFLIRSNRIAYQQGLNWTTVIAISEESFFQIYRTNSVKAIVIGCGICSITVYLLSMLIAFSIASQEKEEALLERAAAIEFEKRAKLSGESSAEFYYRERDRPVSLREQAKRAFKNDGTEDTTLRDAEGRNLSDLSPDSDLFFQVWADVLRPEIEAANIAIRLTNVLKGTEPKPPSIFKKLSLLIRQNPNNLRDLFNEFDIDVSGEIDPREFGVALRKYKLPGGGYFDPSPTELKLLFDSLDKDNSNSIDFEELLADVNSAKITESSATAAEKRRALNYIDLVYTRGLSLSYILQLERSFDTQRLNGYLIFESLPYQISYAVVIVISLTLAFFEAPSSWGEGARTGYLTPETIDSVSQYVLPINGVCLFFFLGDMIFETYLRGFRFGGQEDAVSSNELDTEHVSKKNKCCDLFDWKTGGALRPIGMMRWFLVSILLFDYIYRAANPYVTGPGADANNAQRSPQVLFLPLSSLVRPFWLLTRYRAVRRSAENFMKTMVAAMDVFVLFALLMVIGSIMGVLLLSGRMNDQLVTNYNKFDNVLSGFLTLFVYMASAENYPDVAYPPVNCDLLGEANSLSGGLVGLGCPQTAFHIYSVIFQLLGAFLIVSLVIAVFEGEFAASTEAQEVQDRKKRNLGLVAAFVMLDKDCGGSLDATEFLAFVNGTCNTGRKFSVKRGLELTGQEFMEWVGELSHEFNPQRVLLPSEVRPTPYRRTEFVKMDIPKEYVPGMAIIKPGGQSENWDIYEYVVPPGVEPGDKNIFCAGRSRTKEYPDEHASFANLPADELAHWIAYNVKNAKFPYDPKGPHVDENGEEKEYITYYRYLAADMCVTARSTSTAMGEVPEISPGEAQVENLRHMAKTGRPKYNNINTDSNKGLTLTKPALSRNKKLKRMNSKMINLQEFDSESFAENDEQNSEIGIEPQQQETYMTRLRLRLRDYLNGPAHRSLMLALTLINITQLGMYGTGSDIGVLETVLDTISFLFLIWGFLEIGLRIGCSGWRDFWHVNNDFFQQSANRFDLRVNVVTLFVLIICMAIKASNNEPMWFTMWGTTPGYNDWSRIVLALPLMRAFSTIRLLRDIVMGMITVIPSYVHVFTLLIIAFYFYGALGCLLFASDFKYQKNYDIPDANFNSMLDSIMTLFQLFVGEAWNSVMEAAMNTGKTIPAVLYFLSYILMMTLLFTNLIIGIICSGYEKIEMVRKENAINGRTITVSEVLQALKEGNKKVTKLKLIYKDSGEIRITRRKPKEGQMQYK